MRVWACVMLALVTLAGCAEDAGGDENTDDEVFNDLDAQATEDTGIIRGVVMTPPSSRLPVRPCPFPPPTKPH